MELVDTNVEQVSILSGWGYQASWWPERQGGDVDPGPSAVFVLCPLQRLRIQKAYLGQTSEFGFFHPKGYKREH